MLTSLALLAVLTAAAGAATASPQRAAISHPTGAAQVVLRVSTGGGFVPQEYALRELPEFTLYGDGTVIVPGVVAQIYPGPAITPLVRSKLSERQVQALLLRARRAGLLAPGKVDYGDMGDIGVADAPGTTLTLNAGGRHVERSAYALGIDAGGRISPAQFRARKALKAFIDGLPQAAGTRYAPRALVVYVAPYSRDGSARIVWPLKRDLATAGKPAFAGQQYRCITVTGADAKTLLATLRKATETTRWLRRPGATKAYGLVARPLLPDERNCASLRR